MISKFKMCMKSGRGGKRWLSFLASPLIKASHTLGRLRPVHVSQAPALPHRLRIWSFSGSQGLFCIVFLGITVWPVPGVWKRVRIRPVHVDVHTTTANICPSGTDSTAPPAPPSPHIHNSPPRWQSSAISTEITKEKYPCMFPRADLIQPIKSR